MLPRQPDPIGPPIAVGGMATGPGQAEAHTLVVVVRDRVRVQD